MQTQTNLRCPMRDGVELASDLYRPSGGGRHPAILVRSPYHRSSGEGYSTVHVPEFVAAGFAVVVQDIRGKYDSDGVLNPFFQDVNDGRDALDWVANQRWCDGRIGLWGASYLSTVQMPAAAGGHPALKAIAPSVGMGNYFRDWFRYDGCFALGNALRWFLTHGSMRCRPNVTQFTWLELCKCRTLAEVEARSGIVSAALREWIDHDRDDAFWAKLNHANFYPHVKVPGHHGGGWFDHISRGQFEGYRGLRDHGATSIAREHQYLLVGPWGHLTALNSDSSQRRLGEWDFGKNAMHPIFPHELDFLNRFVAEKDGAFEHQSPVKIFLMGANRWIDLPDWPAPGAETRTLHLSPGKLSETTPLKSDASTLRHDPMNPVPSCGGPGYWGLVEMGFGVGPCEQSRLLKRGDVRYYRSEPLRAPLNVIGEPDLEVSFSANVADADIVAKLCVERADGKVFVLTFGQFRCRYRTGFNNPQPLPRREPVKIPVRFYPIAYRFPKGSRIALMVMHSEFPRIEPHPGTMDKPLSVTKPLPADCTIHHGRNAGSVLRLPTLGL